MKNKLLILCLILLSLQVSFVSADFLLEIEEINASILPFESASYEVAITNTGDTDEIINIYADATNWILSPQTIVTKIGEKTVTTLYITPRSGVGLSNYRVPLAFESQTNGITATEEVRLSLSLDLLTQSYPVNVHLGVDAITEIDPRESYEIKILIKNNNLREIDQLDISIESDLFNTYDYASLEPLAPFRKTFQFELDPNLPPAKHDLVITITDPHTGKIVAQEVSVFEIKGYAQITQNIELVSKSFFKSEEKITLANDGNSQRTRTVSIPLPGLSKHFTESNPQGIVEKDISGDKKLVWEVQIQPQDETTITVTKNYRSVVIAILILIAIIIAYFVVRSPLIVEKQAQVTVADKEGTSAMKVRVFIRNRSAKTIHSLKIIDKIPRIAKLLPYTHLGTLQPSKVTKSEKRGTIVRWEIESLEPYEERIISYKIESKLKIVGAMKLPQTKVKFESLAGKERIALSGPGKIV